MFRLAFRISHNKIISLLSAIIFIFLPYRLGEFDTISALTQTFVSIFFPLILLSLYRMIDGEKFLLMFVIGFAGLILSHLVLAMYACIFLVIWVLLNIKHVFSKKNFAKLVLGVLLVSIIVLPYISLALSQKYMAHINIYDHESMWWLNSDYINAVDLIIPADDKYPIDATKFGLSNQNYNWTIPNFVNIIVIECFIITSACILVNKDFSKRKLYFYLIIGFCLIMFSRLFPWDKMPKAMWQLQFQRRLFVFFDVAIALIAPLWLENISKKWQIIMTVIITLLVIIVDIPYFQRVFTDYYREEKIVYDNGAGWYSDYYPIGYVNNQEEFKNFRTEIKVDDVYKPNAIVSSNNDKIVFNINNSATNGSKITIPRFYYAGYRLTNDSNKEIPIYENQYGLVEFEGANGTYTLQFVGTTIYRIFIIIRYIALILLFFIMMYRFTHKKNKKLITEGTEI